MRYFVLLWLIGRSVLGQQTPPGIFNGSVVGSAPTFKRTPISELTVIVNDNIKIPCKAQGDPTPFITWYYNGETISAAANERYHIYRKSLKISNATKSDEGEYKCKAENDWGVIWGSTKLKIITDEDDLAKDPNPIDDLVKGKPQWSNRKDKTNFFIRLAKQSVKMDCDIQGYPTPIIAWFKDGNTIKQDGSKYIMQKWSLTIKDLALVDKGDYTCMVQNELGTLSWTYTLDVNQRLPVAPIMEGPTNQTILRGDNATFECNILTSDSQPLLQWLKHKEINGSYVNEKGEPYVDVLQQSGGKKTIVDPQYLVLHNVSEKDEGWYTCLVANSIGMNYVSAWLTVVNGDPCIDYNGTSIDSGNYQPGSDPCTTCRCVNGVKDVCTVQRCDPPDCSNPIVVSGECCNFTCREPFEPYRNENLLAVRSAPGSLSVQQVGSKSAIVQWKVDEGLEMHDHSQLTLLYNCTTNSTLTNVTTPADVTYILLNDLHLNEKYQFILLSISPEERDVLDVVNFTLTGRAGQGLFLGDASNGKVYESRGSNSGQGYMFLPVRNKNNTYIMLSSFHNIELRKTTSAPCKITTALIPAMSLE